MMIAALIATPVRPISAMIGWKPKGKRNTVRQSIPSPIDSAATTATRPARRNERKVRTSTAMVMVTIKPTEARSCPTASDRASSSPPKA